MLVLLELLRLQRARAVRAPIPALTAHESRKLDDPTATRLCGDRRDAVLGRRPGISALRQSAVTDRVVHRGPRDDRGRARVTDRRLRGSAVLGAHAPARPAADRGAAADPARPAMAADVARAALEVADGDRQDAGALALDCAVAGGRAAVAGVGPVQPDVRRPAHTGGLQPDPELEHGPRSRARDVLLHGPAVLGAGDRPRAVASAPDLARTDRLCGQRDGRRLGARDHARARPAPALPALRDARPPPRWDLGADRSAARRRRYVGARLGLVHDRDDDRRLSLARARPRGAPATAAAPH